VLTVNDAALRFRPTQDMMTQIRARFTGPAADSMRRRSAARGGAGFGGGQRAGGAAGAGGAAFFGGGEGGPGGGRGGRPGGMTRRTDMATLFYLDANGKLALMRVHTGLSNGQVTEITGPKLKEGMQIIAGVLSGDASATAASTNPFQGQQEQRRGFRPGGF